MLYYYDTYYRLLLTVALIPAIALMIYIYRQDTIDKEPPRFLFKLFLFGVLSGFVAAILETVETYFIDRAIVNHNSVLYKFFVSFALIGLIEEAVKHTFLHIKTWHYSGFNCSFDAVVYAVYISLGFAAIENINYVFSYGLGVGFLRAITSVPGHMMFGVVMGAFYAKSKESSFKSKLSMVFYEILAIVLPVCMHGLFDFLLIMGTTMYTVIFVVYVALLYVVIFKLIKYLSKHDHSFFIGNARIEYK